MPTLIECTTRRDGGTVVEVHGTEYHFKPAAGRESLPNAVHVCAVEDDAADVLLAIPDYRLAPDPARRADSAAQIAAAAEAAAAEAGRLAAEQAQAEAAAHRAAAASTGVPEDYRADAIAPAWRPGGPVPDGTSGALEEMDLEQLRTYAQMLGMKVHPQMGAAKLRANIFLHLDAQIEGDDTPT